MFSTSLGNSTLFQVSATGLVTTAGALDYESVKEYVLVITVTDGGTVTKSSQVTVSVQVSGANEHAPVFGSSLYSVSHLEVSVATLHYKSGKNHFIDREIMGTVRAHSLLRS